MTERGILKGYDVHSYTHYIWDGFRAYDPWVKEQGIPVLTGSYGDEARGENLATGNIAALVMLPSWPHLDAG